jgi:hypothetical protein
VSRTSLLERPEAQALPADAEVSAADVRGCRGRLRRFLQRYLPLFYREEQRELAEVVVQGKLSNLQRKTSEPIACQAGRHRLHSFALDGMADQARRLEALRPSGVLYYPYVEPAADRGKGRLASLAGQACVVVTDEYPSFFLPRMVQAAARHLPVRLEQVDSNGLLPLLPGRVRCRTAVALGP